MPALRPGPAHVFTFKAGLLSRVAHDLRLRVERWTVAREGEALVATFAADSLRVDGVMRDGRLDPEGLSARDRASVERTIRDDVLHSARFPEIRWRGRVRADGDPVRLEGLLTLHGQEHATALTGREARGALAVSASLTPSRWGIPPYTALLGAIKLQDRLRLSLSVEGWPGG